jgi:hypothetical protein
VIHSVLLLLCVAVLIPESNARPPWLSQGSGVFTESAECHTDVNIHKYTYIHSYIQTYVHTTHALPGVEEASQIPKTEPNNLSLRNFVDVKGGKPIAF